ncbi:unnamed protein product [Ceutorhynchus assimilis]|uniref:Sarcospan n=1 Tax=Ceutorhynchus assimilis TaxID=467358 RepID=A0A9N9MS45_9CUCU|nr:unnamed protein product [Ceutorhynchus assimilis]
MTINNKNKEISYAKEEDTDRNSYPASDSTDVIETYANGNNNGSIQNRLNEPLSPSQQLCMMTTVPQNITSRTLGDKHTPTRNSLRHSRMIVMYRNGRIPKKYLPFVIKHYRLVKSMKVITIVLGMLMCLASVWLLLWSPTLNAIDFPYWSAVPVFCSGVVGCFFLGFCPRPYPDRRLGCHYHLTKFISILTTIVSIMTCLVVLIVCIIHLIYIHMAICSPHDKLNSTCVCSTKSMSHHLFNESYHYEDFTCEEVNCFLKGIIATSCVLNVLALSLEVMYLCAQWSSRTKYLYAKVPVRHELEGR